MAVGPRDSADALAATEANDRLMRPGNNNNNRRGRNRGQRKPHGGMPNKGQNFDSGAETRVRGNVYQVLEKYLQLARDAGVAGDRVAAENFLQHADHYYRVVMAMNDGQRPRVGGREISVADVNVQNVSQGLSAALYSGGPSQPSMSDNAGNQAPSQGNGAPRNNNAQGDHGQGDDNQNDDGQGDDGQGDDGQDGDHQDGDNQGGGGNYQQRPQQGQGRDQGNRDQGNRDQRDQGQNRDRNRQRREFRQNDGQQRDNRQGRNDGQRDGRQQDGRQNDNRQNEGRQNDHRPNDNRPNDNRPADFRDRNNNPAAVAEHPAEIAAAPAPVAPVTDEQPDYPEHLLPPAAEAPVEATRAARTPRPRQQRARRPRAAEGDGEGSAEAVPAAEGSE